MVASVDVLISAEEQLTHRIRRNLSQYNIPFTEQVLCQFDEWATGYIDILIASKPLALIEVKGTSKYHDVYRAVGQLIAYSSCFPDAQLYLAVPEVDLIPRRLATAFERVGIRLWRGAQQVMMSRVVEDVSVIPSEACSLCHHEKIASINAALDGNRHPSVVAIQYRLNLQALRDHIAHRSKSPIGSGVRAPAPVRSGVLLPARAEPIPDPEPEQLDQRMAEHYFRTGWRDMDQPRRQKNLDWLQQQLRQEDMGL